MVVSYQVFCRMNFFLECLPFLQNINQMTSTYISLQNQIIFIPKHPISIISQQSIGPLSLTTLLKFQIIVIYNIQAMYENMEQQDSTWRKIRRSLYLIVSISLVTHTLSVTYSVMSLKEQSAGFISIIVSSVVCFFLSSSHLTIYGISILGILYLKILEQNGYSRTQLSYVVAMSGIILFPFWKAVHAVDSIFHSLPGRIHASMVFGIALIVLTKFFPLSIENIAAFFLASNADVLTSPIQIIKQTFAIFNVLTLALTVVSIIIIYLLRNKLNKIPFIAFLILLGIFINYKHHFKSYEDLCLYEGVDCKFYIIKIENLIQPTLAQIFALIPASIVMTFIVTFEQFLYLEEFERRGKRFGGGGNLGNVGTQSRVLGLANAISGCLGGFPICINLFATYQNFAFNQKYGFKGTKWVGILQIPVSYLLYSFLKQIYEMIPLFILFTVVATPTIYFLANMLRIHHRHVVFITILAAINVLTHPVIGLILACFISIAEIAQFLTSSTSEVVLGDEDGKRKSTLANIVQKPDVSKKFFSEFVNRTIEIEDDLPTSLDKPYVLYRLNGSITYLNFSSHVQEMQLLIEKHVIPDKLFLISFRYSQIIDEESLDELAYFAQKMGDQRVNIIFTGLYPKLMLEMQKRPYFQKMLQKDERCMFSIPVAE